MIWKNRYLLIAISLLQFTGGQSTAQDANAPGRGSQRSGTLELSACKLPELAQPARCGVLEVPENPTRPDGERLSISVAVVPATSGKALPDPIVVLMGGPGEATISEAAYYADLFASLRTDRDLLLIDQRGTGRSGALHCELYSAEDPAASLRHLFPPAAVERCLQRLRAQADLTQYTYTHFAHDLEHVRRSLGYGPFNLSAGSYGTRAAQVFIRAYPESVRTAYLGSVVPLDVPTPLTFAKTAQTAIDGTLDACAAEPACGTAFPNLRNELNTILARLEKGQVLVEVPGESAPVSLNRGRVVEWFRSRLYRPATADEIPWLIHQAYTGNWSPIVDGVLSNAKGADAALSFGLLFSITCSEDVPFVREQDVEPATKGTYLRDYRLRDQQAACSRWPKASLPAHDRKPVRSSVPTMFVSGDLDSATPLAFTNQVAPGFSQRLEIVHRGRGHTEWSDCVGRLYEQFVRSGSVRGLEASCDAAPRPPFRTAAAALVPAATSPAEVEFLNSGKVLPTNLPFSEAVRVGNTLFLSGQIGIEPGTLKLVEGGIEAEARQAMENIRATLEAQGLSMNDLVKCTVMLADMAEWGTFNEVYRTFFSSGRFPARSALGVNGLALGARVEVECIAATIARAADPSSEE